MSNEQYPHDAVFRYIFGDFENAASQLRAVLPADLTDRLDQDKLTEVPAASSTRGCGGHTRTC